MNPSRFQWMSLFSGKNRFYVQILFWLVVYALYILLKEYPAGFTGLSLACVVLQETLELMIPCYTQTLLILPFFTRKKWIPAIGLYLFQVAGLILFLPYLLNAVSIPFAASGAFGQRVDWRNEHIGFSIIAFTLVSSAVRMAVDRLMLEQQQKETELRQLKAQLNPHFLFNTLNNLYGLAVLKSDNLPAMMLKLSDLLRYSLYETGHEFVPLQKELNYLGDYIALEKIRLEEKSNVKYSVEGNANGLSVSPLLLMTFVENAFKHFSSAGDSLADISVNVTVRESGLSMRVRNSLDPSLYLHPPIQRQPGGIGMKNVRERLRLLYPGNHEMRIIHQPGYYEVLLNLDLNR